MIRAARQLVVGLHGSGLPLEDGVFAGVPDEQGAGGMGGRLDQVVLEPIAVSDCLNDVTAD